MGIVKKRTHYAPRKPRALLNRKEGSLPKLASDFKGIEGQAKKFLRAGSAQRKGARLVDIRALNRLITKVQNLGSRVESYHRRTREEAGKRRKKATFDMMIKLERYEARLTQLKRDVEARQK